MQCAQCHHHPFERWSQKDYYSFGAFFSRVGRKPTATRGEDVIFHKRGIAQLENKKTKVPVKPAALGGPTLAIPPDEDPRLKLADWMSDKANPFFAKSLVNRYWKHFFKRGLVEPEDDIRETNPATNPELLEALATHFVASGYDLKAVVRVITRSHTYQLSSIPNAYNGVDRQNFSHYYPKRLQAEVLLDAIDQLTGRANRVRRFAARLARDFASRQQLQPEFTFLEGLRQAGGGKRLRVRASAGAESLAEPSPDECIGREVKTQHAQRTR